MKSVAKPVAPDELLNAIIDCLRAAGFPQTKNLYLVLPTAIAKTVEWRTFVEKELVPNFRDVYRKLGPAAYQVANLQLFGLRTIWSEKATQIRCELEEEN